MFLNPRSRSPFSTGALACSLALLAACGTDESSPAGDPETGAAAAAHDACQILTADDVSAVMGIALEARLDPDDQGPNHSTCGYYPPDSYGVMYLTVYYAGGQSHWDTWQVATRHAGQLWEQVEKVDLDSITGAAPVAGLGDKAYFGGILPSLVLKGDVLMEFKMPLIPDEAKNFPVLAQAALARLP